MEEKETYSLQTVYEEVKYLMSNCLLNNKSPKEVPFVIRESWHNYKPSGLYLSCGNKGFVAGIEFYESEEIKVVAPDIRPEGGGEYWHSRGADKFEVSGFIKSKKAGERLLRFVKYILEKDDVKTRLDYREYEPEYIQFKFSAEEFNVEKLNKMSRDNNSILTEEIIKACVLKNEKKNLDN